MGFGMLRKLAVSALLLLACLPLAAQTDWIRTGTNLGVEKVRVAVPDFKTSQGGESLVTAFNTTLWNDLYQAGLFDLVSKSFNPAQPGVPSEVQLAQWGAPPPNASMLVFGNLAATGNELTVQGWLYDVKNPQSPQVLGKQYKDAPSVENARLIAHKFADEIIFRLGGGINGIAESKIYFISNRTGHKEVWVMDYDGSNQHPITHIGSIVLSPRASPDGSRVAFSWVGQGWEIGIYSTELKRLVAFPRFGGTNSAPAYASDGTKLAFSSSRTGDPEIYTVDAATGGNLKRLTNMKGPDTSPAFNPKTNAQIAFVSGRSGLPQIYTMDVDGANVTRMTDQGYAISPSWSPNGQFLTFAWIRHYGPGAPGAQDIYVMDVASHSFVQLTHDGGRNDFPSWAPDGRHIVFQSSRTGRDEIWSMLADGSQQTQLTNNGSNTMPNWSAK